MSELLKVRKKIKSKMPRFIRSDTHKKKRLALKWRKPKGRHNKMRLKKRGHRKTVKIGYGSPKEVKYTLGDGLMGVLVSSLRDIKKIDSKSECIIISKKVGLKKKTEIVKKSKELGLKIVNIKDVDLFMKEVEEKLKAKKASKEKVAEEKKKKKKEMEEKAKEKDKESKEEGKAGEDELAEKIEEEEEKKKEEEKKILTKKE